MEVIQQYPIQIIQWGHAAREKFIGVIKDDIRYGIALTPEDRKERGSYYLKIEIERTLTNTTISEAILYTRTFSFYKLRFSLDEPREDQVYGLLIQANDIFGNEFSNRMAQAKLPMKLPIRAAFDQLQATIRAAISIW